VTRSERLAIAAAALVALATPALTLGLYPQPAVPEWPAPALLAARPPAALGTAYTRTLFGTGGETAEVAVDAVPADAPELAGIVGRIGADAVALVRTSEGRTRSLGVGQGVDGWTLESLAIDAAYFTRGAQRARVPLPAGE